MGACLLSLIVLLPLAALRAPAQQPGAIVGVVQDASGAVVPGARVTVGLMGTNRKEFATTNETGQFALRPVPDGSYSVTVAKPGFALFKTEGIQVKGGAAASVQVVLNIGSIAEAMEIRGEAPGAPGTVRQPPVPPLPGAPAPAASAERINAGGNVQPPKLTNMVRPVYPPDCKAEGVEGTVALRGTIGRDGSVIKLEPINQLVDPRLVQAATDAVRQWRYQPTLLNAEPVEIVTEISLNFRLAR